MHALCFVKQAAAATIQTAEDAVRTVSTNTSATDTNTSNSTAAATVKKRGRPAKLTTAADTSVSSGSSTAIQQQQFVWSPTVSGSGSSSAGLRFIGQAPTVAPLHVQLAQSPRQVSVYSK